jgi:hypothetical protein
VTDLGWSDLGWLINMTALNAANTEALTYSDQGRLATASGAYGTRSWTYDGLSAPP